MEKFKDWCIQAFDNLPITLKMLVFFLGFMCVAMVWSGVLWLGRKALGEDKPKPGDSEPPSLTGRI